MKRSSACSLLPQPCWLGGATLRTTRRAVRLRQERFIHRTVKDFAAINPHMRLVVELKDAKGTREVRFEGHSTNNMYRSGYRKAGQGRRYADGPRRAVP